MSAAIPAAIRPLSVNWKIPGVSRPVHDAATFDDYIERLGSLGNATTGIRKARNTIDEAILISDPHPSIVRRRTAARNSSVRYPK